MSPCPAISTNLHGRDWHLPSTQTCFSSITYKAQLTAALKGRRRLPPHIPVSSNENEMPVTILPDSDVRSLLCSLTRQDILDLQQSLADALHFYSTSTDVEDNGCCASYQPQRTHLKRRDGSTTLVMPATSNEGMGVKIVTLSEPVDSSSKPENSSSRSSLSMSSLTLSPSPTTSSTSSTTTFSPPASINSASSTTPRGSLTLFDGAGNPRGFMNAEELTAFRTALASTMIFKKRKNVHDLTVFGAGKQAFWHIRLALLLRGPEIHHLTIVNRTFETASTLAQNLFNSSSYTPDLGLPKIAIITPSHTEYGRLLKNAVRDASAIFCTTPSLEPLFPAGYLTNTEGRKKGRYIAAIGSYKPHMLELHPDILRQAVAPQHGHHHHKHARQGGAVIVDSVAACLREAGEVIKAGLAGHEVVELGELVMLKRDAEKRRAEARARRAASSGEGEELDAAGVEIGERRRKGDKEGEKEEDGGLRDWLERGNVIYKSVGLGLMDVVVGGDLVRLADERGVGTRIENF